LHDFRVIIKLHRLEYFPELWIKREDVYYGNGPAAISHCLWCDIELCHGHYVIHKFSATAPTKKTGGAPSSKTGSTAELHLKRVKGENLYRDAKSARHLKIFNRGRHVYDRMARLSRQLPSKKTTSMGRA